jgi:hypothetical protein
MLNSFPISNVDNGLRRLLHAGSTHRGFRGHDMKMFLYAGLLLIVVGIASLVVPIPSSEKQGIKIGDTNIGVQTTHSEKVSPVISAVLIAGGIALSIAGTRASSKS